MAEASPLNQAHQSERQAERFADRQDFLAAAEQYNTAAGFMHQALKTTEVPQAVMSIQLQHEHLKNMAHQMAEKHKLAERAQAFTRLQYNHSLERRKEEAKVRVEEEPLSELGSERKLYLARLQCQQFTDSEEGQLCCQLRDKLTILEDELVETQKQLAFEKEENVSFKKENKRLQKELEELKQGLELTYTTLDISMACDPPTNNGLDVGLKSHISATGAEAHPVSLTQPQKQYPSKDSSFLTLPPLGLPPVVQFQ